MRRPPKIHNINQSFNQKQMTPWQGTQTTLPNQSSDDIPTYRKQIMQKFLATVLLHSKKSKQYLPKKQQQSSQKQDNQIILLKNHTFNQSKQKNITHYLDIKPKKNYLQCSKTLHLSHHFNKSRNQDFDKKKCIFKTTVINFDSNTISKQKKKQFSKNNKDLNMSHTRKMRLRQTIANRRVIQKLKSKNYLTKTPTSQKGTFYIYDFVSMLSHTNPKPQTPIHPTIYLRRRPTSQQFIRSTQFIS